MKRLREMIFDNSSSDEEEDIGFEFASDVVAMEEDFRRPRRGSQLGQRLFLQDRVMGHDDLVRDYFAPNAVYPLYYFWRRLKICIDLSSTPLQRLWRDMILGLHREGM